MKDDSQPFNPLRIDIEQEFEARYWSRMLGLSRAELRSAVEAVGNEDVYEVARYTGRDLNGLKNL